MKKIFTQQERDELIPQAILKGVAAALFEANQQSLIPISGSKVDIEERLTKVCDSFMRAVTEFEESTREVR